MWCGSKARAIIIRNVKFFTFSIFTVNKTCYSFFCFSEIYDKKSNCAIIEKAKNVEALNSFLKYKAFDNLTVENY